MQANLKKQIEEMKIQKTKKCGVLPFVTKFDVSCNMTILFCNDCGIYSLDHHILIGLAKKVVGIGRGKVKFLKVKEK